jgi:hypothetical protein
MFTQLFEFGYRVVAAFEKTALGPEVILLDLLREGIAPDIRYQLR